MRIAASSTMGTPASRLTWNTEYWRSSGNPSVMARPPESISSVRSSPTSPRPVSSMKEVSNRFVARLVSLPCHTV